MDRIKTRTKGLRVKRGVLVAAATLAIVGGGVALANIDFRTQRVDRAQLSIETVQRGTMEIKVSANGELVSTRIEQLAAQVAGRVAKADIKPGTVVNAGDLLVELTNPQLIAGAEEAQSAWEGAVAELKSAEAELLTSMMNQEVVLTQVRFNREKARAKANADEALSEAGVISKIELNRSRLDFEQLDETTKIEASRLTKVRNNIDVQLSVKRSRVAQLARALERARTQASDLRIVAGIRGVVQSISVEVGEQLQPGSPIGRIAQQDDLYAELKVPARDATMVQPGQRVVVDTRSGTVSGTVSRVDPGVTEGTVTVDVVLQRPLPAGARPQLAIEGVIYVSELRDALFVGKPSYVKGDSVVTVYKLDAAGRYADRVAIKAGKLSLNHLQVVDGLKAGDRIITSEVGGWQDQERVLLK